METSLPFGSENLWRKSGFKFPETKRLYSQREYAAPKIIPKGFPSLVRKIAWGATIYHIWRERNARLYKTEYK